MNGRRTTVSCQCQKDITGVEPSSLGSGASEFPVADVRVAVFPAFAGGAAGGARPGNWSDYRGRVPVGFMVLVWRVTMVSSRHENL